MWEAATALSSADSFDSPEEAALHTFSKGSCRVVATRVHGDAAYVLLDAGPAGKPYLYGVNCERQNGRWSERSSSNGPGWSRLGPDTSLGTLTIWGQAPPVLRADRARVEFEGEVREEPVTNGVYLSVWWNVPSPQPSRFPRVSGFLVTRMATVTPTGAARGLVRLFLRKLTGLFRGR